MIVLASAMGDAAQVGLAIGLIMAFTLFALSRIFTRDLVRQGARVADRLERAILAEAELAEIERVFPGVTRLPPADPPPIPARRRRRARIVRMTADEWKALTPEQRVEKCLASLPLHADDENGLTGKSVAHRLGLSSAQQVTSALTRLRKDGRATSRWDKRYGNRVYWKASGKS